MFIPKAFIDNHSWETLGTNDYVHEHKWGWLWFGYLDGYFLCG